MENQDGKATAILVLGIVSIICCAPCGIASLIMYSSYKDQISSLAIGKANAGKICAIVGLALWAVGLVLNIFTQSAAVIFSNM